MRRTALLAGVLLVLLGMRLEGQGAGPAATRPAAAGARVPAGWSAFTAAFDDYVRRDSIVGASVLVMRDGRVTAHHEYGFGDRRAGQRVDENTIYHWASVTKTLTAIAIMQLRDRGLLSLDDRITTYIPELRQVHDSFGSVDEITLRMLLSHSSGFQNPTWPYGEGHAWEPFEPTRWEQLVAMMPYQEVRFRPGSRYGYSNPAFIYLARVIEQLSGDPWAVYVQKNIWTPLGMTRSYVGATPYHLAEARSNNYTLVRDSARQGVHVRENGRDFDPGITIPNGGWNAPLGDLVTYVAFLTNATHGDPARQRLYDTVLRRSSLEEMWRPLHRSSEPGAPLESMGLSFFVAPRGDRTFIGHTGSQAGFRSFVYFDPRTSAAVIGVYNTINYAHADESQQGFDAVREAAFTLLSKD